MYDAAENIYACFNCHKEFEECDYETPPGVIFSATGNYGSQIFDELDGFTNNPRRLEIFICDLCLFDNSKYGTVLDKKYERKSVTETLVTTLSHSLTEEIENLALKRDNIDIKHL